VQTWKERSGTKNPGQFYEKYGMSSMHWWRLFEYGVHTWKERSGMSVTLKTRLVFHALVASVLVWSAHMEREEWN
jgi:hypothetical protein